MSEEMIVRHCAPTLASLKTGNMFTCRAESRRQLCDSIRTLNCRLRKRGLRMLPLRYRDGSGLVYLFRPSKLNEDLQNQTACRLLGDRGYPCANAAQCIRHLQQRLNEQAEFPHEIGLFLGYPPKDVEGFILQREDVKCVCGWKVYNDVEEAQRTFARFQKCTSVYLCQHAKGMALERLAVRS